MQKLLLALIERGNAIGYFALSVVCATLGLDAAFSGHYYDVAILIPAYALFLWAGMELWGSSRSFAEAQKVRSKRSGRDDGNRP
jgi:hypothetical protein